MPAHLGEPCLLGGGPVRLIYFPVTTTDGDLCLGNGSTVMPTPTGSGPNTVSTLGTVFTSGTAYVSFATLYASYDGFWNPVGPNFINYILPVSSAAVSTQCGGWFDAYGPGKPLNYANLNYPVPASAYKCMDRCEASYSLAANGSEITEPLPAPCSTIWDDYNPMLAVPTEVSKLVPAWSTCKGWDDMLANFWFDPPVRTVPPQRCRHVAKVSNG